MPVEREQIDRAEQIRSGLSQLKTSLDYDVKKAEIAEIDKQMTAADFWDDSEKSQAVVARMKALKALTKPMDEILAELDELDVFFEIGRDDEETAAEIPAKLRSVEETLEKLQTAALLNGPFDANDAILTINARDGGTDANDWAEMLLR
ncbi:MAG: PCRF domain-containing protein, partial [Thermoguttaceae bacterium]|nr:PCRF domain-containing protein [Thermoguttaceae bacterium]